jgi:membrane-associated phospholipid phosphatase
VPPSGRVEASTARTATPLAPPWAAPVAVAAFLLGGLLAALVWHATKLNRTDASVYRWQVAYDRGREAATVLSGALAPAVVLTMLAGAAVAWRVGRRDALLLALAAPPTTLAVELAVKRLVHRQWNGDPALIFPSGHLAVATSAAVTAVLVVRVAPVAPRTRVAVALLGGGYMLLIAAARLVETVHSLTDMLGGTATGLAVTLGLALAITGLTRRQQR